MLLYYCFNRSDRITSNDGGNGPVCCVSVRKNKHAKFLGIIIVG